MALREWKKGERNEASNFALCRKVLFPFARYFLLFFFYLFFFFFYLFFFSRALLLLMSIFAFEGNPIISTSYS
jgi:hypothetical protein